MKSRFAPARKALIFWTLFIGLGAVGGAACMLADPSGRSVGMSGMLPYFQVLPFADVLFQDLFFSGIALLLVNGITNLTAAALLFRKKPAGVVLGGVFGVTLMLWILIQFYMFPLNFMSTLYFIFGFCQAATGYAAWVFQRQEAFQARPLPPLPSVEHPRRLVVYFSRMGYVKKLAYEIAEKPARRSMKFAAPNARRAPWASGGAAASACTGGICPSGPSTWTFPPLSTLPSARPSGCLPWPRRCAPSAARPRGRFGKRITCWCTTLRAVTSPPPGKWIVYWG